MKAKNQVFLTFEPQSSVCTSICISNPCIFQTGSQCTESGGRYERYLKDSFSVCWLGALPMRFLMSTIWLHFAGRSRGKEELHKPFISRGRVGQCWAPKDRNTKESKGYVFIRPVTLCQPYIPTGSPRAMIHFWTCQYSWGSVTVIPEGMALQPQQMEKFSFVDLLETSWSLLKKLW